MTFLEMLNDLNGRLSSKASSGFYTDAQKKLWLNQSYLWAAERHNWPHTASKETDTTDGSESKSYPSTNTIFSDSIEFLRIDSKRYYPLDFKDYLRYKEENPSSSEKVFAQFGREYYISPAPASGLAVELYCHTQPSLLVEDGDETVFADSMIIQEAIVKRAKAICLDKQGKKKESLLLAKEVEKDIDDAWEAAKTRKGKFHFLQTSKFEHQDLLNPGRNYLEDLTR